MHSKVFQLNETSKFLGSGGELYSVINSLVHKQIIVSGRSK